MKLAVGSTNPVKVAATEQAVASQPDMTVTAVGVESGVPEQPQGRAETITGAENRARRALEQTDADLGVGIEGGVEARNGDLYLIMWAAVTDGTHIERGGGPTIRLPDEVADRIQAGGELGPVLDDVLGTDGIKTSEGAAGVFTDGAIDRQSALVHAVAGALGPFVTDLY